MTETEEDWLTTPNAEALLRSVGSTPGDRKLRLLAVASCWWVWHTISPESREIVQVAERLALGEVNVEDLVRAYDNDLPEDHDWISDTPGWTLDVVGWSCRQVNEVASDCPEMAEVCREVLGNPFRVETIDPFWLRFQDGFIPRLARAMDESKDFERMPILGDALEEAGCASQAILDHCREARRHYRGCWVLDLILERS